MERTSEIQQRLAPLVPRSERVSSASSIPPPERRQLRLRCWSEEGGVDRRYPRVREITAGLIRSSFRPCVFASDGRPAI